MSSEAALHAIGGTVLVVAAIWASCAFARRSAALRNALWRTGLVALWLVPAGVLLRGVIPVEPVTVAIPVRAAPAALFAPVADGPEGPTLGEESAGAVESRGTQPLAARIKARDVLPWLWAAGAAMGLFALLRDLALGRRALRRGEPADDPALLAVVDDIAGQMGLPRAPEVYRSADVSMPAVFGAVWPALLVPPGLEASDAGSRAVLAHELAHIRRRDLPVQMAARATLALLWWHPGAWLVSRELSASAEQACDDWAVALTGERRAYADVLVGWAEDVCAAGGLACRFRGRELIRRVRRTLAERGMPMVQLSRRLKAILAVCSVAAILGVVALRIALGPAASADGLSWWGDYYYVPAAMQTEAFERLFAGVQQAKVALDLPAVEAECRRLLAAHPNDRAVQFLASLELFNVLECQGKRWEALAAIEQCVALAEDGGEEYETLARVACEKRRAQRFVVGDPEAAAEVERLSARVPDMLLWTSALVAAEPVRLLGAENRADEQYQRIQQLMEAASEDWRLQVQLRWLLGSNHLRAQRYQMTLEQAEAIDRLFADHPAMSRGAGMGQAPRELRVRTFLEQRRFEEARQEVASWVRGPTDDPLFTWAVLSTARAYAREGKHQEAQALLRDQAERAPDAKTAGTLLIQLASIKAQRGDAEGSLAVLDEIIAGYPDVRERAEAMREGWARASARRTYRMSDEPPDVIPGTAKITVTARFPDGTRPRGAELRLEVPETQKSVTDAGGKPVLPTVVGADGDWVVYNVAKGGLGVSVRGDGFAYVQSQNRQVFKVLAGESKSVSIPLVRGGSVTGRVVDGATDKPVRGALVLGGYGSAGRDETDVEGRYLVRHVAPGMARITASATFEGLVYRRIEAGKVEDGETITAPDIELFRGGWISGRAKLPAEVRLGEDDHLWGEVVARSDGVLPAGLFIPEAYAGRDGKFLVGPMPRGRYTVEARLSVTTLPAVDTTQRWKGEVSGIDVEVGKETRDVVIEVARVEQ